MLEAVSSQDLPSQEDILILIRNRYASKTTRTTLCTITPREAKLILDHCNPQNRGLSNSHIASLVRVIEEGRWVLTPAGCGFDRNGIVLDGQHRFAACVAANKPILINVTYGMDPAARFAIDKGRGRSLADDVRLIYSVAAANRWTANVRVLHFLLGEKPPLDAEDVMKTVERFKKEFEFINSVPSVIPMTASVRGAFILALKSNPDLFQALYGQIAENTTQKGTGAWHICRGLIEKTFYRQNGGRKKQGSNSVSLENDALARTLRALLGDLYGEEVQKFNVTNFSATLPAFLRIHGVKSWKDPSSGETFSTDRISYTEHDLRRRGLLPKYSVHD